MATDHDPRVDGRRSKRRVRARKTPAAKLTACDAETAINHVDSKLAVDLAGGEENDLNVLPTTATAAASNSLQQSLITAAEESNKNGEIIAKNRSGLVDDTLGYEQQIVEPSTRADDIELNDSSSRAPPPDDSRGLQNKSQRKRRQKIRQREPKQSASPNTADNNDDDVSAWFAALESADTSTVKRLAKRRSVDINSTDEGGNTGLHLAVEAKNAKLVGVLTSLHGIDVDRRNWNGETPLYVSSRAADISTSSLLLGAGADVNVVHPDDGSTPLHCACQSGDGSELVTLLLGAGSRGDAGRRSARSGVAGITPLHDAADVGDVQSVGALLEFDETLGDAVTDRGCTALHVAARHGHRDIVDQLLTHNAFVAQPGADSRGLGVQPLHLAAEHGHLDTLRTLLTAGAEANASREFCGKAGVTGLHLAVMRGHMDIASVLLEAGATVDAGDEDGATALHVSARGGIVEAARLLLQHGAVVDATTCQQRARQRDNGVTVRRAFGQTPLHFAVRYRHLDVAAVLLEAGCDVNAAEQMAVDAGVLQRKISHDSAGKPALLTSTFKSRPGLKTSTTTTSAGDLVDGYTALHWAVENDDRDAVQMLLDADADVDRCAAFDTHVGVTPLHLAAQDDRADIAADLLRHGATRDPHKSTRNRENITPLHQAVYNGHLATVTVLLAGGCDPNEQADNGYAAIHYAAQKGSIEILRLVLDTPDCDVSLTASTRDQQGITALHLAVQSGCVDVVRALAAAGAPIDAGKKMGDGVSGVTALHQAVYQEREEIVAELLALGSDPHQSMDGWYTPLHVAAEKGCTEIARRLVEATSSGGGMERPVNARASLGEHIRLTPLHVAAQHGHHHIIRLLVHVGADVSAVRGFGDRSAITALHLAAENGFVDAVLALLDTRTDDDNRATFINAQDSLGFTPLHLAVQYQFPSVVQTLLDAGADQSILTSDGLTARRIAEQLNDTSMMQILGPDPQSQTKEAIHSLSAEKRKSSKIRGLLCGLNKH